MAVFLCLANQNRKFWFVKFSTKTDQNNWESIGFDFIAISVGLKRKQENLEKWSVTIWGVGICETKKFKRNIVEEEAPAGQMVLSWYISETDKEKERIEIKEKNHTMRDAKADVRSSRGGRQQMWTDVWWRPVCVRGSDRGYERERERVMEAWVWERWRCECEVGFQINLSLVG